MSISFKTRKQARAYEFFRHASKEFRRRALAHRSAGNLSTYHENLVLAKDSLINCRMLRSL